MDRPLAEQLRPKTLNDVCGQHHLLDKGKLLRKAIESNRITNMIFYGPPGTGKTTIANIIADATKMELHKLNGTTATIEDIKKIIEEAKSIFARNGILLYLDEIQYLNKKQQQSLLDFVERGEITLIASTTENPYFYVYPALLSRCTVFEFKSLKSEDIAAGLKKAATKIGVKINADALEKMSLGTNGDMRKALNNLDFLYHSLDDDKHITEAHLPPVSAAYSIPPFHTRSRQSSDVPAIIRAAKPRNALSHPILFPAEETV